MGSKGKESAAWRRWGEDAKLVGGIVASGSQVFSTLTALWGDAGIWFFTYPYAILLGGFAASEILLWFTWSRRSRPTPRSRRWIALSLSAFVALLTLVGILAVRAREQRQGPLVPISAAAALVCGSAQAAPSAPKLNVEARCELVEPVTSLVKRNEADFLDIAPDPRVVSTMLSRRGLPSDDPAYHAKIVSWLRERARAAKLPANAFLHLRKDDLNLVSLTLDHPDIVARLVPTSREFMSLDAQAAEVVSRWARRYVGRWNPRLRFTVDNSKMQQPLRIIAVRYDVQKTGELKGNVWGIPDTAGLTFELAFRVGPQRLALASQDQELEVPKGEARTFDLIMVPAADAPIGPIWDGDLTIETNRGNFEVGRLRLQTFNSNRPEVLKKLGR